MCSPRVGRRHSTRKHHPCPRLGITRRWPNPLLGTQRLRSRYSMRSSQPVTTLKRPNNSASLFTAKTTCLTKRSPLLTRCPITHIAASSELIFVPSNHHPKPEQFLPAGLPSPRSERSLVRR